MRILLVDGDHDSRTVYRILLEYRGYEVIEAENGEDGWRVATTERLSAVVTELTLRGVDGHTLVQRLRGDTRTRGLPVVVLTARGLPEEQDRAQRAGCSLFLTKPMEPKQLVRMLDDLLGSSA